MRQEAVDLLDVASDELYQPIRSDSKSLVSLDALSASVASHGASLLQTIHKTSWDVNVRPIVEARAEEQRAERMATFDDLMAAWDRTAQRVPGAPSAQELNAAAPPPQPAVKTFAEQVGVSIDHTKSKFNSAAMWADVVDSLVSLPGHEQPEAPDVVGDLIAAAMTGAEGASEGWPAPQHNGYVWGTFGGPDAVDWARVLAKRHDPTGGDAVALARRQIGRPYVSAAESPSQGFDCSGLVYYVFGKLGVDLKRMAHQQWNSSIGQRVSPSHMKAGDVIYFTVSNQYTPPNHCGIYDGHGGMIVAPRKGKNVQVQPIAGYWRQHLTGVKRYV
jgi:cell wall-associated NlpC family hydrolase